MSLAGGGMRSIDSIDAYPPGVDGSGDWYDEMLLSGDRVIVVGYSYRRGGTDINRFRLDRAGRLRFEDAYHLRSNDYFSRHPPGRARLSPLLRQLGGDAVPPPR